MGAVPQAIGPYRIDGRLGAGGMGEVYRAWGRTARTVGRHQGDPSGSGGTCWGPQTLPPRGPSRRRPLPSRHRPDP